MFLADGTRVFLGDVVGWSLGIFWPDGGFPLGVVDPGPPVDASKKLSVLAPRPSPGQGVFSVGLDMAFEVGQICFQFVHYIIE